MSTYVEQVCRFVVEYQETMNDQDRAAARIAGHDPDNLWSLTWSFDDAEQAELRCQEDQQRHNSFCAENGYLPWKTFRVRELGAAHSISRRDWFS